MTIVSPPQLSLASTALLTDLYQFTMAHGYWKAGLRDTHGCFHLFFRHLPFKGGFAIASGLEAVMEFIEQFRFMQDDLDYLGGLVGNDGNRLFDPEFLEYLADLQFSCDVDAMPEGSVAFPNEPLLRIKGPLIQAQLLESPLLALINFSTLIATKAARICIATEGDPVLEFGLRRAQGVDGALTAARAAYVGGCSATSNVLAGKIYGIPVRGTHAHSWIQTFEDERKAFQVYAETSPNNCVFLVDTYDTLEGVKKAIEVGKWLREQGREFAGIRLDSGDLAYLSIASRELLDNAGFHDTQIVASNELDEEVISDLKRQGAKIDVWGVGTHLVTAYDQPALDGVYKLGAIKHPGGEWEYRLKLSEQMVKVSNPGILQVKRFYDDNENIADVIYEEGVDLTQGCVAIDPLDSTRSKPLGPDLYCHDILEPIFREGKRVYTPPPLADVRNRTQSELSRFHSGIKRFLNPHQYVVGMEQELYEKKIQLITATRHREFQYDG